MTGPRRLSAAEYARLLQADVPAVIATLGRDGAPQVTTVWFVWSHGALWFTSRAGAPHVRHLRVDPRAAFVVQVEGDVTVGGRPDRQVKGHGRVTLHDDHAAVTQQITARYAPGQEALATRRAGDRVLPVVRRRVAVTTRLRAGCGDRAAEADRRRLRACRHGE